jgi:protein tyrosine phosphatase (PTP) superfamily phosphohydrolase (DUF442 family)
MVLHRSRFLSIVVLVLAACAQGRKSQQAPEGSGHAPATLPMPSATAEKPADLPGLHNVVAYGDRWLSGSVPEGEAGFATLAGMGIKTVVSVDGAKPDLEAAKKHGLRYVHLPIGYDGVPAARSRELAAALALLPGPTYMHCHHGKHRSAGALATAAVMLGELDADEAMARMKVSGTAADYKGLWRDVAGAKKCAPYQLGIDPTQLPEVATVSGMVHVMSQVDEVNDLLKSAAKAKWQVPADHPDLVPAAEAMRLRDLFGALEHDKDCLAASADFRTILTEARTSARALAEALGPGGDATARDQHFAAIGKSCKDCHVRFRDNK